MTCSSCVTYSECDKRSPMNCTVIKTAARTGTIGRAYQNYTITTLFRNDRHQIFSKWPNCTSNASINSRKVGLTLVDQKRTSSRCFLRSLHNQFLHWSGRILCSFSFAWIVFHPVVDRVSLRNAGELTEHVNNGDDHADRQSTVIVPIDHGLYKHLWLRLGSERVPLVIGGWRLSWRSISDHRQSKSTNSIVERERNLSHRSNFDLLPSNSNVHSEQHNGVNHSSHLFLRSNSYWSG